MSLIDALLLVLQGNCPNCNADANTYFGDILTIPGSREKNNIVCANCKASLTFDSIKGQVRYMTYMKNWHSAKLTVLNFQNPDYLVLFSRIQLTVAIYHTDSQLLPVIISISPQALILYIGGNTRRASGLCI